MRLPSASTCLIALALSLAPAAAAPPAEAAAAPTRITLVGTARVTAPALRRPLDERRFDFETPAEGLVELDWEPCPGASLYRVQVSAKADFSEPLNATQQLVLGQPATRAEILGLPAGGYYLRVAAVDDAGRQGPWSPARRFSVNQGAPPAGGEGPALEITSTVPAGAMAIVNGTAAPGTLVEASVNGQPTAEVTVGEAGSFSVMVEANAIGQNAITLLASDKSGRSTSRKASFYYGGN